MFIFTFFVNMFRSFGYGSILGLRAQSAGVREYTDFISA